MAKGKQYLGDGVYAALENGMVKLTTENGISTTNTVYLDHEVLSNLLRYLGVPAMPRTEESRG